MNTLASTEKQFLFRCEQSWFALPAIAVREVTVAPQMVRVPGCHRALAGLCRQRSEFIPVISLAGILDVETSDEAAENGQMITLASSSPWALRIAEAAGLESLDTLAATDVRSDDSGQWPVMGTAVREDQVVRVLDPNRLYGVVSQALEDQWQRLPSTPHPTFTRNGSQP